MKKHLAKLSLALLSAVFVLGCQDQGSGVVGVDLGPQFDKKGSGECDAAASGGHCHGDPEPDPDPGPPPPHTFTAIFEDDCTPPGGEFIACDITGGGNLFGPEDGKTGLYGLPRGPFSIDFLPSFRDIVGQPDADNCFAGGSPTDPGRSTST